MTHEHGARSTDVGASTPARSDEERRDRLVAERQRMAAQLVELRRTFDELVADAELEPPDDEHDPDGTTAYERAQVVSLAASAEASIGRIDAAIAAIDRGEGAVCEVCGDAIPDERLDAVPGTVRCVRCAAGG
jgi:RNA polymerase-binding transcription factor DksA